MIDQAAAPGSDESDGHDRSPAAEPLTLAEQLLELQRIDTEADQLRVRRERLPERDELAEKTKLINGWERRRKELTARLESLSDMVEASKNFRWS